MQINRLLETVYILLREKSVTAKILSEYFEVSQRTVYRDIDALSLAGIPIYTEKGKGGGIKLLPDFTLSKSILSESEQNEILTALQGLSIVKSEDTERVLRRLSAIFNKKTVNWLDIDYSDWNISNEGLFNSLKNAILERRVVEFDYYGASGEKTRRRAEPLQLWFKSRAWYLKSFCHMRHDYRVFKLTRLKNMIVTDDYFAEREYVSDGGYDEWPEQNAPLTTFKLKIGREMSYRVYDEFDEQYVEKQPDGGFVVTLTWPEDDWISGMIFSYGEFIEVLEPARIRDAVRDRALLIARRHG
jgi:predicted DNA-binding transcriptional regulator YafY